MIIIQYPNIKLFFAYPDNINILPICSMYGIFTYIWVIFGAHVDKYSTHGAYGLGKNGHIIQYS